MVPRLRKAHQCQMYCDTALIIEALEHYFADGYRSLYPKTADGRDYRPIIRGFASYWTDVCQPSRFNCLWSCADDNVQRPFFRATTGLIPQAVWNTSFGVDRANLIGHQLDAEKLGAKVPRNKSNLDMQLVSRPL
jgi:hypothetical protein